MPYRLIGQDAALQVTFGGAASGAAPTYTTAVPLMGIARSISIDESISTENVAALGDGRDKFRTKRGTSTIRIEHLVLSTGFEYNPEGGTSKIGQYVKVEYKSLTGLSSYLTYQGVITGWSGTSPDGATTETVTILCDAEHA